MRSNFRLPNSIRRLFLRGASAAEKHDCRDEWSISPFPDGHTFGFTLIHDADDAYSGRLAPLFDVFDEFALKITATAFAFWADWAANGNVWRDWNKERNGSSFFAAKAVPLADDEERQFYLSLARRGHEIGLHTPSDTSSPRQDVIRAFDLYRKIFGDYPAVYVEHRVSAKKDAQANEGSKRNSIYYNTDLLNSYGPWVWIDDSWGVPHKAHPKFYDILAANGSPFHPQAARQYGIEKAFLRTGRWREGDGDGFLSWYSEEHIDSLEKDRGLALVYTHLDKNWLDPDTKTMRPAIKDRLHYLTSKNGWFVPAGTILDRVDAIRRLSLVYNKSHLKIVNTGSQTMEGLTLISNRRHALRRGADVFRPTVSGDIVTGKILPRERLEFDIVQA